MCYYLLLQFQRRYIYYRKIEHIFRDNLTIPLVRGRGVGGLIDPEYKMGVLSAWRGHFFHLWGQHFQKFGRG